MKLRHVVVLAMVGLALGACRKKEPPPVAPAPAGPDTAAINAAERARQDSIARARAAAEAEAARREAEARARAAEIARVRETLTEVVYFEYDSEQLTSEAESRLQRKIAILRANPGLNVRVEGHADERGSTEYNLALGQRRAESVRNYLSNYGIDTGRVTTLSYGEERPVAEGEDESAWRQNRRAEFVLTGGDITNVPSGM